MLLLTCVKPRRTRADSVAWHMAIPETNAYSPAEVAARVEAASVAKTKLAFVSVAMLGLLAGAFIAIGSVYFTLVVSDPELGFAASRVLGGAVFSVGLMLVIVGGGELFTGNNLLAMAWADGLISTPQILRNWVIALVANALGAGAVAVLVSLTPYPDMNGGLVGVTAVKIAAAKVSLPFWQAFVAGVLCNVLVCMAVWLAMAGRSIVDKAVAILFPISAFVAAGFEHSVANMYLIPAGLILRDVVDVTGVAGIDRLDWVGYVRNLVPVTLGNVAGGSGLVGLAYYLAYCRGRSAAASKRGLRAPVEPHATG